MPERLYSLAEVASIFGVAPKTIRNWTISRKIEYVKVGAAKRIRESEIERLIVKNIVAALDDAK